MKEIPLALIKVYPIDKDTNLNQKAVWLPKQYCRSNNLTEGDQIEVYLNPLNEKELIIRVKKNHENS